MTLTGIIEELREAQASCSYDIRQEWTTQEEKLFLLADLGQLKTAIAVLEELKNSGSDQFFNGCISK